MITTTHYLMLSLVLFTLGVVGMVVRRNFITVLMCVELILNAANINFIAFSRQLGQLTGQVFAVFVITIAAARGGHRPRHHHRAGAPQADGRPRPGQRDGGVSA